MAVPAGGRVRSPFAGTVARVGERSVTVASGATEVEFSGIVPAVAPGQAVASGAPLGTSLGEVSVRATRRGRPFDFLGVYAPELSLAAAAAESEWREKAALARLKRAAAGGIPGDVSLLLERAARRYGLDPAFLKAVAWAESGFDPRAVSPAGALGVMQLMPETAAALGVADPFDPRQNVDAGARLLRRLLDAYGGDPVLALTAYNAGSGAVERHGGVPPFGETRAFVARVLVAWRKGADGDGGRIGFAPLAGTERVAAFRGLLRPVQEDP